GNKREAEKRAQQLVGIEAAMTTIEGCGERRAFAAGFQNSQLDAFARRQHTKMVAHRHFEEGRDVEQLVLLLAYAGVADVARGHGQHVGMDAAKRVAHLVDQQRQLAIRAITEIDRKRIKSVAEQTGVTQQQYASAREVNAALGR